MVTFKPQGRLGNFLFCAATMIAYARKHNLQYSMPNETNHQFWNPVYLPQLVNPQYDSSKQVVDVRELTLYKYDQLPFDEKWRDKNIVLHGYFQNPKYFDSCEQEIYEAFNQPQCNFALSKSVSVHVRRGDYLKLTDKHPGVSIEWITNAMRLFTGYWFVFFSDDIEWCKKTFQSRKDCIFIEGQNEYDDLISMSRCEHHINSASTFSWWGAWLNRNKDKKVIVPKQWLMPSHSNQWTEEIVPKQWIRI